MPSNFVASVNENYVASNDPLTTAHGYFVLSTIWYYSFESLYELHRVVASDGRFKVSNFLKAMSNVAKSSVDIVNTSGGIHHRDCNQRCRVCKATNEVVESGTIVVAGAGNDLDGEEKSIYCPALSESTISVGSFEGVCGYSPDEKHGGGIQRRSPSVKPPGAYWVTDDEATIDWEPVDIPYCSLQGCSPYHDCSDHRIERIPDRNVSFDEGSPDVFAPDHYVYERDSGAPGLRVGTSFATAVVTGALGEILSVVAKERVFPSPSEVNRAINNISTGVGSTFHRKFDGQQMLDQLL